MKKANIMLDDKSTGLTIIEKMDFDKVNAVQHALGYAFIPEDLGENDNIDNRFFALWHIFLVTVGWTEDEYWAAHKAQDHNHCPDCGAPTDEDGEHGDGDDEEINKLKVVEPSESKPN